VRPGDSGVVVRVVGVAGKPFDEARRARLVGLIEAGCSLEEAAGRVDVTRQTVFRWQARGKAEDGTPAAAFAEQLAAARGDDAADVASEEEALRLLTKAARKGSVTAAKALVAHHRSRAEPARPAGNPFENLDELAKRRTAG
jgi:hypothetical protein